MQLNNKRFCDWDLVRFLQEKDLIMEDGTFATISVIAHQKMELMIFFGKSDDGSEYEARVYKARPSDQYIPNILDNCKRYEENDEYATFFFETFEEERKFISWLGHRHMEYVKRPARKLKESK